MTPDGPTDGRTDQWTDGRTDGRTDRPSHRDAMTHLKRETKKTSQSKIMKEKKTNGDQG